MKKLFLLAMLLGLAGCGDNNQSDTTQTNTQVSTSQNTQEAVLTATNYRFAAPPQTMGAIAPLAGWTVTNSTTVGASTLIEASRGSTVSAALITPNAKQVANVLKGGLAGIALSVAVDQLLGAIDWVMDPENSRIKYKSSAQVVYNYFSGACIGVLDGNFTKCLENKLNNDAKIGNSNWSDYNCVLTNWAWADFRRFTCTAISFRTKTRELVGDYAVIKEKILPSEEKSLPLETVAEQVITNADSGSLDAQVATNIAAQNILNDVEQAEPVVQDLDNNYKNNCPSGITNNGSCWICSRESWSPIRSRVVLAKEIVFGLNKCSVAMNSSQLLTRYKAYSELGAARDKENACWSPQDPEHLDEAIKAKATAAECNTFLGVLGQ
ncbi:hypothetical protein GCM10025882_31630 [Acinetobacter gyllenbergii]|uniref:Uncharacterized protein n=1 Tax=Acinetobacter gyllenbergii CIP 110306 = MTCC 11365 TaxID=1217657 RepID=A0A829HC93_9GAMM|nr:hypothetical protein [Acinetobacter gyllenbergii]EPF72537.1 hypothetical protein F957_03673 [Acinetobacter gyllenbergii CIP 110306 = MTCC 11365]EPH31062.1 hypothetical protein L293_2465 [Acinetobacter gyllenbergii CIP 110306 = MTCC 11365]GMA12738.1 hypothetical protein GCM10025882_31630 [Acinetobacter gyllenbergii]